MQRETIHERIRSLRERRGLTQTDLARACGVDKTSVSKWEHGTSAPSRKRLDKVARALGVSLRSLAELMFCDSRLAGR